MKSEFLAAITQLSSEKGVPKEMVLDALKAALVSAYKRNFDSPANDLEAFGDLSALITAFNGNIYYKHGHRKLVQDKGHIFIFGYEDETD